jgi:hypothetical protein
MYVPRLAWVLCHKLSVSNFVVESASCSGRYSFNSMSSRVITSKVLTFNAVPDDNYSYLLRCCGARRAQARQGEGARVTYSY